MVPNRRKLSLGPIAAKSTSEPIVLKKSIVSAGIVLLLL